MINRSAYNSVIAKMQEVCSHYENGDYGKKLREITDLRDNFDVKLMVIGHFSAGKSALLNALLGRPGFLPEAQEPQTALATELIYDEKEGAFAYGFNETKEVFTAGKEYKPSKYSHLEYRLNVPTLKEICDFTIVDTPGFDAGIEAHTKALANYIGFGSAYLVVIDQEKGGIDQTTLEFIQEISNYSDQIAVLINKCDKITAETAESIAESARALLTALGLPYKVYTTSKKDTDIARKLITIVGSFDAQAAFNGVIGKQIQAELVNIEKTLSVTEKEIFLDTFDLDSSIDRLTRMEEELAESFGKEKEKVAGELENTVQEVLGAIRNALTSKADAVAEALLSGNQTAAEAIITGTIRPVLLAKMKDISIRTIDNTTANLDFTGVGDGGKDLADITKSVAENIRILIAEGKIPQKKGRAEYRTITGLLAILTDIVAPWTEVLIFLAPDIADFLRSVFGKRKAKHMFLNNVIPQIINKIEPQVRESVETTNKLILEKYQTMLNEKVETIKHSIKEAHVKKEQRKEEFEKYKETLANDLAVVQNLLVEMR